VSSMRLFHFHKKINQQDETQYFSPVRPPDGCTPEDKVGLGQAIVSVFDNFGYCGLVCAIFMPPALYLYPGLFVIVK
jgi:hypothetical protein